MSLSSWQSKVDGTKERPASRKRRPKLSLAFAVARNRRPRRKRREEKTDNPKERRGRMQLQQIHLNQDVVSEKLRKQTSQRASHDDPLAPRGKFWQGRQVSLILPARVHTLLSHTLYHACISDDACPRKRAAAAAWSVGFADIGVRENDDFE